MSYNTSTTLHVVYLQSTAVITRHHLQHHILVRFSRYFLTSEYQLGFKKSLSCRHAIYCVKNVIEHYVNNGFTVNVCSIDLSKVFDRMNHYALFTKLMERKFPNELLNLLEHWFSVSSTCVRWGASYSQFFNMLAGTSVARIQR